MRIASMKQKLIDRPLPWDDLIDENIYVGDICYQSANYHDLIARSPLCISMYFWLPQDRIHDPSADYSMCDIIHLLYNS